MRLLAAWQQQRRDLTDRLDSLLLHGPTAVARVAARERELRDAMLAEQQAFEAFVAHVAREGATPAARPEAVTAYPPLRAVPHTPT